MFSIALANTGKFCYDSIVKIVLKSEEVFNMNFINKIENKEDIYQNNEDQFKVFYEKHSKPFWRFIFKSCGDESMADDILQESYFKFIRANPQNLNEHQLKAYLYKIAVRLIIDHKRKIQVEQKSLSNISFENRKDADIFLSMDMEILFKQLKLKERTLLWLAYIEGYTHREISEITGTKEKGIRVQLFRIKKKFALILKSKGYNGAIK